MIYVTSDLHGLPLAELQALLDKAGFGKSDWLYILGDVVDRRGDGGVGILQWLLVQDNAQLLLGNHEAMLLACDFVFDEITQESLADVTAEKLEGLQTYLQNGGGVTLAAMQELMQDAPETAAAIRDYLKDAPLYETVTAGEKDFLLCHAGLDNFSPEKKLCRYTCDEFLWCRPKITDVYFDDIVTVFGHTPTKALDKGHKGKILFTKTWIDIDVGAAYGYPPALLRLDDLKEFYL